jgi:hypothetical protein
MTRVDIAKSEILCFHQIPYTYPLSHLYDYLLSSYRYPESRKPLKETLEDEDFTYRLASCHYRTTFDPATLGMTCRLQIRHHA